MKRYREEDDVSSSSYSASPVLYPSSSSTSSTSSSVAKNSPPTSNSLPSAPQEEEDKTLDILKKNNALISSIPVCPECKTSKNVIEDTHSGFVVCSKCGLQIGGQIIDEGAEWRTFADDSGGQDASRVGGKDDQVYGLRTMIAEGSELSKVHNRSGYTPEQRKYEEVTREMKAICTVLQLPRAVLEEAQWVCHTVLQAPVEIRGKNAPVGPFGAACVYQACKMIGQARSLNEMVAAARVEQKPFNKQLSRVMDALSSQSHKIKRSRLVTTADENKTNAVAYIDRYCNALRYPMNIINASKAVVTASMNLDVVEDHAAPLRAAAVIFLCAYASGMQPDIAKVAAQPIATPETIMKIVQKLYAERLRLFPQGFLDPVALERLPKP